jgi:uncharacterized protein (TIGR03118 family)
MSTGAKEIKGRKAHHRLTWIMGAAAMLLLSGSLATSVKLVQADSDDQFYKQLNLISDLPNEAIRTDPNLVNPWGIAYPPTGPFWIADNGTGVSTLYDSMGRPFPKPSSGLVVTVPPAPGSTEGGNPTGIVFNGTADFVVTQNGQSGPARFIFANEDGSISGWNPTVNPTEAVGVVNNSGSGAIYKGLALGSNASGNLLFATNFHTGVVDMFNSQFGSAGSFPPGPNLPALFAPFGIRNIGGNLYVTYAKKETADSGDDEKGPGNGFVDVFDTSGNFIRRVASQGTLNSPWGLAVAPSNFGPFSNALLVGNFGDGRINAFDHTTDQFLGQLEEKKGNPITIDGLWSLTFGNGGVAGRTTDLFFTAGIDDENHGLFGRIRAKNVHDEDDENQ